MEVHNILPCHQKGSESRPRVSCTENFMKFGHVVLEICKWTNRKTHKHTVFRDHLVEPVPEENFWTLWCKGRLTEADTETIRLGATPSGLTSAHLHHQLKRNKEITHHNTSWNGNKTNTYINLHSENVQYS